MQHPIISLFVAIGLFILGGFLVAPDSGVKHQHGPDGQLLRHPNGSPVLVTDHYQDLRTNWPAYSCFISGTAAFGWTVFLETYWIVVIIRKKIQKATAPNDAPGTTVHNSEVSGGDCGG